MDGRETMLQRLSEARATLEAAIADLDPAREIYPGWTLKHLLAHIAGWDDALIAALQAHAGGEEPGTPAAGGIDLYNVQSVQTREPLNLEQVRAEWQLSRRRLIDRIATLPDDRLETPLIFPWGPRGTVRQLVAIFAHHEEEHAADIEALPAPGAAQGGIRD